MLDPDAEDVAGAGRGDRAAAARLIARHAPKLLAVARRMLGSEAEAEDAVQDVFLKLWTHAGRWQPGRAKFETWLYRVALNACYDRLRRRKSAPLEEAVQVPDDSPGADLVMDQAVLTQAVEGALAALPERQRAVLLLCHFQGCSNGRAAEIMGLSVEAVESLLARGRRGLKARLEPYRELLEG
jgi:RNA polymerase sigma-70 factor (ECF subfamily)